MHATFYRLFRLRRLILVAIALPILSVGIVFLLKGPAAMALAPVAAVLPLVHVLRYPNAWMETLALSLSLMFVLIIGGLIGPDVGLFGLVLRLAGLAALGVVLVLAFTTVVVGAISLGKARPITTRARRWSRLAPEAVKGAVVLYPGRVDDRFTCGPANEDGIFEITMHLDASAMQCGADATEAALDPETQAEIDATMAQLTQQLQELGAEDIDLSFDATDMASGAFDATLFGIVAHSDDESHDVIVLEDGSHQTTATRMTFTPKRGGTQVGLEERSAPMPPGYALGFWLQDYAADYLIDEIDRAEGRRLRANRSAGQASLLEDIAQWMIPREEFGH